MEHKKPAPVAILQFWKYPPWVYPVIASLLLAVLLSMRTNNDFNLGFHLRTGQWIIENHAIPRQEVFTYPVEGHETIDGNWLYQTFLFLAYRLGGYSLVNLAGVLAVLSSFLLVFLRMRLLKGSEWSYGFLLAIGIMASELRFGIRPEVFSWFFLSLTFFILELWSAGRKTCFTCFLSSRRFGSTWTGYLF